MKITILKISPLLCYIEYIKDGQVIHQNIESDILYLTKCGLSFEMELGEACSLQGYKGRSVTLEKGVHYFIIKEV